MMRIGLDAGYDPEWPAGLQYVRNVVYTLASLRDQSLVQVRLLPINAMTVERLRDLISNTGVELAAPSSSSRMLIESRLLSRRMIRKYLQPLAGRPLDPAFLKLDVTYPGWGKPIPGTPQMNWIYDFQHIHLPHLFPANERHRRHQYARQLAYEPGVIILSSQSALSDFRTLFPNALATPRVWRFCSAFTTAERKGQDPRYVFHLPDFYFYVANQFWEHKDHLTLFKALPILRAKGLKPIIVCTGIMRDTRNPSYINQLRGFLKEQHLEEQVRILGFVNRGDQREILRTSAAVIQPSRFEGWSTVVEDARAVGRPVILSDISVHKEQLPQGRFFQTGSPESLADVMERAMASFGPGPDLEAEERAETELQERRRSLAAEFLRFAREAMVLGRGGHLPDATR